LSVPPKTAVILEGVSPTISGNKGLFREELSSSKKVPLYQGYIKTFFLKGALLKETFPPGKPPKKGTSGILGRELEPKRLKRRRSISP